MTLKFLSRKFLSVLLSVIIIIEMILPATTYSAAVSVWSGETATSFAGGTGTEIDPYLISTPEQLAYMLFFGKTTTGQYYRLTADIYLNNVSNTDWASNSPNSWYDRTDMSKTAFVGNLDGDGHTIHGLYYSGTDIVGLFPQASNTTVSNLRISNAQITSSSHVSTIVSFGQNSITIKKCIVDETVKLTTSGNETGIGGFVGYGTPKIYIYDSAVMATITSVTVDGKGSFVGNVWGNTSADRVVKNSFSTIDIRLFGHPTQGFTAENVYNIGTEVQTIKGAVTKIDNANMMKGTDAKDNMPNLDWTGTWRATEDSYPVLRSSNEVEWNGIIANGFASGLGTKTNPYIISNAAELVYAIKYSKADTYYKLSNDIYLNSVDNVDWATGEYTDNAPIPWFTDIAVQGNFDGAGHTVYGLYYNGGNGTTEGTSWNFDDSVALFPEIAEGSKLTVTGLGVDKSYLSGKNGVGAIVGAKSKNNATLATLEISQCYVGSDVTLIGFDTGAFLGINRAVTTTVTDSYSLATQNAKSHSGLVSDKYEGDITLTRCYNGTCSLDTKNTATCTNSYAITSGGKGTIVITQDQMKGIAAADNMTELGNKYVTTADFPALRLFMDSLDDSINKIIETKALSSEEHRELARKTVGEGLVLLKNKNNVLPLSKDNTVAFFGKGQNNSFFAFGGYGSGAVYTNHTPLGPAEVFAELANEGKIGIYEPLYNAYLENSSYVPDTAMYESAAKEADTAIIVITRKKGEGNDMKANEWILTDGEKALLSNSTTYFENVIVILNTPSTFSTEWSLDGNSYGFDVDSVLVCHAPGEMGGYGIADVILGDVNPSGKLTDTYASSIDDYPSTDGFYESADYVNYTEDIYVGYRYFETFAPEKVIYEFGYGISYTTFDITTDSVTNDGKNITVKATVKNTGDVAGKETVQVYFSAPQKGEGSAVLSKPAIELAGFQKTKLLQPGESETVTIIFAINDMASFDDVGYTDYKSAYVLEAGTYDIFVGNSVKKNVKQGEYTVETITVTEQLSKYGEVTLEKRLEADGTYTDPSMPILKEGQTFIKSDTVTVIEAESASKVDGTIRLTENYGANGYLTDGFDWYSIPEGVVLGNIDTNAGNYFYYDLIVQNAGTYKFGFVASNGNGNGFKESKNAEDLLTLEYSTNGENWQSVNNFAYDSINTHNNSAASTKYWFNFIYNDADTDGNYYNVALPKGAVQIRFKISDDVTYTNTNIDKFFVIPVGNEFGLKDVFEYYGLSLKPVLKEGENIWIEAEDYATDSNALKKETFTGQAFFNTGSKYSAVSGMSIGTFHSHPNGSLYYDIIVEKAGTYNIGFISADGNKAAYTAGKFGDNLFSIEYSIDGGTTFTTAESPAFDSVNTYDAMNQTGKQWFNYVYSNTDTNGELYQVTLPEGKIRLRFKIAETIGGEAINSVTNCNLDKFCISSAEAPCTLEDVCKMYGVEYMSMVNSIAATWFEGEDYTSSGTRVGTESFLEGNGALHDGTVYAALPAGAVVGFFDKNTTGYAEYDLVSEKAGTYNIGFTLGNGNLLARDNDGKAPDVIDVLISTDDGTTWTKQFALDVKYTGKDVTGTIAQYWNFYYSTTDFDGNQYTIQIPEGTFKMRLACNETSPVYGGANIDKFVIYPSNIKYTEQNAVAYYFNKDDNSGDSSSETEIPDPLDIDFETDNYIGITYADIMVGNATWDELIEQMSYNELIDLAYGKYGSWSYGYTGMIGFSDDAIAEKYGIYGGDTADGPQGLRMEYKNTTFWPNATLQACTWNTELIYDVGEAVGEECRKNSIDMWLAPGMNIHRSPLCGRNFEYYSEDPFISGIIAAAMVNGVESKGVSAVVKHYAVNNKESNRKFSDSRVSEKALREIYLEGFRIVIEKADPICVMSSYNKVNGEWTSTSEELLKGIMREEWGYTGLIMSDWETTPTPSVELIGGNNCHMLYADGDKEELQNAVIFGRITRDMLEENAYYILSNLAKMPDTAINLQKTTVVTPSATATILATDYAKKSQRARQVINNNIFDMPGINSYFYEYNIDVETAGRYAINLEYSAFSNATDAFEIYINGELVNAENDLDATGTAYVTSKIETLVAELPAGKSTIRIKHIGANDNVNYRALHFTATYDYGDLNGDGVVNVKDLVRLKKILVSLAESSGASADIDQSGKIDSLDLNILRKILLGNITDLKSNS